jgi:hypothetical protein
MPELQLAARLKHLVHNLEAQLDAALTERPDDPEVKRLAELIRQVTEAADKLKDQYLSLLNRN